MKKMSLRWFFLILGMSVFWLALEANFFRLQVGMHHRFEKMAKNQYYRRIRLHAQRGLIFDWAGNRLVTNTIHYDLAVDPTLVKHKEKIARLCARAFNRSESYYLKRLNEKSRFVFLERKVTENAIAPILQLKDPGVIKIPVFRRSYLYRTYAAQLIGFTDPDDRGLGGLELQYDDLLKGKDGEAILQYLPGGRVFYNPETPVKPPRNGQNIYLTIDKNVQTVVEQALERGVEESKAKAGMCVVLDPDNGRILAMANYPSFDPNRQQDYPLSAKRNRVIADVFEPGSTIKSFVAATLLQEKLKRPTDLVFCENGRFPMFTKVFTDSRPHGWLTFRKVITYSSNIGMIKLSADLPANTLFRYLRGFGFGFKTGVRLLGEESGFLSQPATWSKIRKASISIGYGIGVTALQLATAYAALINGGKLYRPFVVWKIMDETGRVKQENKPLMIRQVISPAVSAKIRDILASVVEEGTGTRAKIEGVPVGGKTGTAKKVRPEGGYYHNRYVASFAGFAPLENPKYVCVVVIDEPRLHYYGGQVAAPVFKEIISKILNLEAGHAPEPEPQEGDEPSILMVKKVSEVPDLNGFTREAAINLLKSRDVDFEVEGDGEFVLSCSEKDGKVILETGNYWELSKTMPRLTGLTLREALALLDLSRVKLKIKGDPTGIVLKQSLKPGVRLNGHSTLTLTCVRP